MKDEALSGFEARAKMIEDDAKWLSDQIDNSPNVYCLEHYGDEIDHTKTKAYSPQTNGICERFHRTAKEEFYEITFRKNPYTDLGSLQTDLDTWIEVYNNERCHQGKMCCGRTPMQTLQDGRGLWEEKVSGLN